FWQLRRVDLPVRPGPEVVPGQDDEVAAGPPIPVQGCARLLVLLAVRPGVRVLDDILVFPPEVYAQVDRLRGELADEDWPRLEAVLPADKGQQLRLVVAAH